jgi:hypothetical protein
MATGQHPRLAGRAVLLWLSLAIVLPTLLMLLLVAFRTRTTRITVVNYLPYSVDIYEQSPTLDEFRTDVPPFGAGQPFYVRREQPLRLRFQRDDGRLVEVHYFDPDSYAPELGGPVRHQRTLFLAITPNGMHYLSALPENIPVPTETDTAGFWLHQLCCLIGGLGWGAVGGGWLCRWLARRH